MDWTDFVFPAKHVLGQAADSAWSTLKDIGAKGTTIHDTMPQRPSGLDVGKMAQEDAYNKRPEMQVGAHQPTIEQLKGMGGSQKPCPTCGK